MVIKTFFKQYSLGLLKIDHTYLFIKTQLNNLDLNGEQNGF